MGMLAFFPWVRIDEPVSAGEFTLVPFVRGEKPAGAGTAEQVVIDRVLSPYRGVRDPIRSAVLVQLGNGSRVRDLDDEERDKLFEFAEILTIAAIADRELFSGNGYCNAGNYRLHVQKFRPNSPGGATFLGRRRDRVTRDYVCEDVHHVYEPVHTPSAEARFNASVLESLLNFRGRQGWQNMYEAILAFNLANTDSHEVSERIEAVHFVSAFERLLDCRRGKEHELAKAFVKLLKPTMARSVNGKPVREKWIRDLFRARGHFAHGKIALPKKAKFCWDLRTHLLLGSAIFPIVLKLRLKQEDLYELVEDDLVFVDAFEELVEAALCPTDDYGQRWKDVICEHEVRWRVHVYFEQHRVGK